MPRKVPRREDMPSPSNLHVSLDLSDSVDLDKMLMPDKFWPGILMPSFRWHLNSKRKKEDEEDYSAGIGDRRSCTGSLRPRICNRNRLGKCCCYAAAACVAQRFNDP